MSVPMDVILLQAVDNYLDANPQGKMNGTPPDRPKIKREIVDLTRVIIDAQNALLTKTIRMRVPDRLQNIQIARIIERVELVVSISCGKRESKETEFDLIGVYETDGPNEGIYNTSDKAFNQLVSAYNHAAVKHDWDEVRQVLKLRIDRRRRCMNKDLIAVNNGIFDYKKKVLMPFTPDKVFLSKSRVDYNPAAQNPTIHNPDDNTNWDVESWMEELSNDHEIVNLLWEVLGAIIRPFNSWNQSAWFYSTSGNSGKGTLCELMRNLCGQDSYASIALSDFSKDFQLEPLIHANAIIVDENDVGVYLDKVANLKAVITNDVLLINRKFKTPVSYQFFGLMVQCLNEYPRIRDTSDSFYRRQLFIPFDKCFTGRARTYIKDEYLSRKDVLEYVLFRILNMNYYKFSEPEACKALLADYKEFNNPVLSFVEEIFPQLVWGIFPWQFLYDLYEAWYGQNNPSGKCQGKNTFIKEIADMAMAGKIPGFTCLGRKHPMRPKKLMDSPEPLILQYNLQDWMNPNYRGSDKRQICTTAPPSTIRGLVRIEHKDEVSLPPSTVQANESELQIMNNT